MAEKSNSKETVGNAVKNILEKEQHEYQVGEIIDEYSQEYVKEMQKCVETNAAKFESPFYIVVLHKKEPWALNVLRNYFIARQTRPSVATMWTSFKHYMHTVYECDTKEGKLKLVYTLPSPEEAATVLKNWTLYDKDLVRWCHMGLREMEEAAKIIPY